MIKISIAIISTIFLLPAVSSAQKVMVTRGPYKLTFENETSVERSKLVADGVLSALKTVDGMEPLLLDLECEDSICLKKAASENIAKTAVMVKVEEGAALYNYKVVTLTETVDGEVSGRFNEAIKEIENAAVDAVHKSIADSIHGSENASEEIPLPIEDQNSVAVEPPPPTPVEKHDRPNAAVWTTFSITLASAATWGILQGVGSAKLNDYESKDSQDRTPAEKKQLESLRTATFVMIGVTATAFVATGTLFLVARHKKKNSEKVSFFPALAPTGGALLLKGSF